MTARGVLRAAGVALSAAVLLALLGIPASAHARLLASDPADAATVDSAPLEVVLRFSEEVSADFASVEVTAPDGSRVDAEEPAVRGDHVYTRLLPLTQPGAYTVSYRVVSADSHPIEGTTTFTLAEGAAAPAPAEPPAEPPAPAEPAAPTPEAAPEPEVAPAPSPAPQPSAPPAPSEPAPAQSPSEAATELAAARDDPASGLSPWVPAAIVVLVLLAAGGYLATRARGGDAGTPPPDPSASDGTA